MPLVILIVVVFGLVVVLPRLTRGLDRKVIRKADQGIANLRAKAVGTAPGNGGGPSGVGALDVSRPLDPAVTRTVTPLRNAATASSRPQTMDQLVQLFATSARPVAPVSGFVFSSTPERLLVIKDGLLLVIDSSGVDRRPLVRVRFTHGITPDGTVKWIAIDGHRHHDPFPQPNAVSLLAFAKSAAELVDGTPAD